ncbi:uncharacterized protein [Prorops nasuta]|uniref:uncharacterized protein n=1 Tax=Prorops nasuta TaxID=863751 RepID=UPI0034CDFD3E
MSDRIKVLIQKRVAIKSQITNFNNTLDKGTSDTAAIKLRIKRLTELYHTFEESLDELMILDPQENHQVKFDAIQERFYTLASRVENLLIIAGTSITSCNETRSDTRSDAQSNESATVANNTQFRTAKLPEITLPVFNGKYEEWLTFKNAFCSMIDARNDITDLDKFGANYSKAWELLERSYEVKRILISKHISSILNLPIVEKEIAKGFSKLADDMQQHVASLEYLGVRVAPEIAVHLLESKLPRSAMNQWESGLSREEFPDIDKMYESVYNQIPRC